MSDIKNVLIIGASGNLGPSVLKAFLGSSFNTTVLSREGSSSTFPSDVKVIRADYGSLESLTNAFKGQDAVISVIGFSGFQDQKRLIDAAIAAGVKRFIPSEFGSDTNNPRILELVPIFQVKVDTVEYLRSKEDAISWTILLTGPFYDWGLKVGFLGFNAKDKTATLTDNGESIISASTLHRIGSALVKLLEKADLSKNQSVYVSSFEVTQKQILAEVEKLSGAKWTVQHINSEDLFKSGREGLKAGNPAAGVDLIKGMGFSSEGLSDFTKVGLWNEKLGLDKEDFEAATRAGLNGQNYGE